MRVYIHEILLAGALILVFSSCKTQRQNKLTEAEELEAIADSIRAGMTPIEPSNADIIVSFYSVAYGIDHGAKNALDNFLETYKASGTEITVSTVPWGREGEVDYCIDLSALGAETKASFKEEVKELMATSELVHIYENQPCRDSR